MSPISLEAIRFPGQQSDERVFLFLRRSSISFFGPIIIIMVMILLPLLLSVFFSLLDINAFSIIVGLYRRIGSEFPVVQASQLLIFAYSAYYFFVASYFLVMWLDYYFDITIVTNERIIDINQVGLFNRSVSELYLTQVQDVSGAQKGLLQNMFHYGDVTIQTAGGKNYFIINHVNNSYDVARKIIDLQEALMERRKGDDDAVEIK